MSGTEQPSENKKTMEQKVMKSKPNILLSNSHKVIQKRRVKIYWEGTDRGP